MRVKQPKNHKKAASIVAIGAAAVLLVSGTFAWFSGTIHAQNVFTGSKNPVVLHDDFEAPIKNVYVENTGTAPVYVRIQLSEAMDLTTDKVPATIPDSAWSVHKPVGSPLDQEDAGQANPGTTDKFHDYFKWTWGGQTTYIPAGSGTDGLVQNTQAQIAAARAADPTSVKQTPVMSFHNGVVSADYYLGRTQAFTPGTAYIGWIYDADGWAYWSQPLLPGEATGPIISKVTTAASLNGADYWYVIDVAMESVDAADLPMWIDGAPPVTPGAEQSAQAGALGQDVLKLIETIPTTPAP